MKLKNDKLYLNIFVIILIFNAIILYFCMNELFTYDYSVIVAIDISSIYFISMTNSVVLLIYIFKYIKNKTHNLTWKQILNKYLFRFYILCIFSIVFCPITIHFGSYPLGERYTYFNFIFNPLSFLIINPDIPILNILENIIGNVIIFIPLGFYISYYKKFNIAKTIAFAIGFSTFIESIQYIFTRFMPQIFILNKITIYTERLSDFGDVTLNSLGVLIGYLLYKNIFEEKIIKSHETKL